ncbi:MAG TPA: hypothetical protein VLX44_08565 [Xanthobacteraceae bacterium]|nr:hypothetical protein [Xanthobacteraceae bacterium]
MSTTFSSEGVGTEAAGYGGLVDAVGGVATVVLAIVALAGIHQEVLAPIAVIVFGAALLIEGGAMTSDFAQIGLPAGISAEQFGAGGLSTLFLVGAAGIVLGVLALIGIAPMVLTSVAIIAFGAAAVISSNSVRQLYQLRSAAMRMMAPQSGSSFLAGEMASGSAAVQLLAGLTAIVLGILAVTGTNPVTLILSALIVLGAAIVLSGSTLSGIVLGFMPTTEANARARVLP